MTLAQEIAHPFSRAQAVYTTAWLHQLCREGAATQARSEALLRLATAQEFALLVARGLVLQGWAWVAQGQADAGIAQMQRGLAAHQATGAATCRPYFLTQLAEAYGQSSQAEDGLRLLAEALALIDRTGERWYEAEGHRLKGELLLQQAVPDAPQAEACFQQALAVARRQQAKSLELRAAMSLGHLWQQQGKRQAAHDLLAPLYGWFTEGFDTADLQEARALLEELAE